MKIITWNCNSIRARLDRCLALLERHQPDVLCLQELKVADDAFPIEELRSAGYHAAVHGQKTYNGVAILSRSEPSDVRCGMDDGEADDHARLIAATVDGVRVLSAYFPNGSKVGSAKYVYKLKWMGRLRSHLDATYSTSQPLALCGDFNVAPFDDDVARPDQWRSTVLANDEVREALEHIRGFGLEDVFRPFHPEGGVYSWWDYRQLAFPKGNGLRIDHVFATPPLATEASSAEIDRDERKGKQPSDHAPVIVTFDR